MLDARDAVKSEHRDLRDAMPKEYKENVAPPPQKASQKKKASGRGLCAGKGSRFPNLEPDSCLL